MASPSARSAVAWCATSTPAGRFSDARSCGHQFSVTSGTIFASRKLPHRDHLLAIAIFVNGAKGVSALQLSRDLNAQYKTAFVLADKMREAMAAGRKGKVLRGHVETADTCIGG